MSTPNSDAGAAEANLPNRVRPVLKCLLDGLSEKEAAAKLTLSPHTVREYTKLIYDKLEVKNRAQLVRQCLQR